VARGCDGSSNALWRLCWISFGLKESRPICWPNNRITIIELSFWSCPRIVLPCQIISPSLRTRVWRLLSSSWFSSASSVLHSLNSVLFLDPFLFPGFLSLVLGLLEQLPLAFSSAWALPLLFFVVCQVPAGGRSCNTTKKKIGVKDTQLTYWNFGPIDNLVRLWTERPSRWKNNPAEEWVLCIAVVPNASTVLYIHACGP